MNERSPISVGRAAQFIAIGAVVLLLYWAQEILIPIALAILISFLLFPLVRRQLRWRFPRALAVGTTVLAAGVVAGSLVYVVSRQAISLNNPELRQKLEARAREFGRQRGFFTELQETAKKVSEAIATSQPATQPNSIPKVTSAGVPTQEAVAVHVVDEGIGFLPSGAEIAPALLHVLATAGMVVILVIFILLGAESLRDRLIWLAGTRQISLTTTMLDDVGATIGRFLRSQLMVNLIYGAMTAAAMWLIGIPNALLFGMLAGLLRYVPFIGAWIAMAFPLLLSFAISDGWGLPFAVIAAFVVCEVIINAAIEPFVFSESTGITAWGVVVTSFFWGWLWGPVGLILAVPMTTCLVVLGKYIPHFSFFTQFFGSGDVLPVEGRLYQRLLAWDETGAEAIFKAELEIEDATPARVADKVLVPVLQTLKRDLHADAVSEEQASFIQQTTEQIDQLGPFLSDDIVERPTILIVSGQSRADEIASRVLARLAIASGHTADVVRAAKLASEAVERVGMAQPFVIGIVQVSPISIAHATYLLKMLRRSFANLRLLFIGLQDIEAPEQVITRLTEVGATKCLHTFDGVLQYLSAHEPVRKQLERNELVEKEAHEHVA